MFSDKIKRSIYEEKRIKLINDKKEKELHERETKLKESLKPWHMSLESKIINSNRKINYERVEDRLLQTGIEQKEKIIKQSIEQADKSKIKCEKKTIKCIDIGRLSKKTPKNKNNLIPKAKRLSSQETLKRSGSTSKEVKPKSIANLPYSMLKPRFSAKLSDFNSERSKLINSSQNSQVNYNNFQKIMENFKSSEICYGPNLYDDIENLHLIQRENNLQKYL